MTITIELTPDEEARLRARAAQQKQAPEAIVHGLVRDSLQTSETIPAATPAEREAQKRLAQRLLEQGAIPHIPPGRSGPPPRLITVRGRPVSETLIEDRR